MKKKSQQRHELHAAMHPHLLVHKGLLFLGERHHGVLLLERPEAGRAIEEIPVEADRPGLERSGLRGGNRRGHLQAHMALHCKAVGQGRYTELKTMSHPSWRTPRSRGLSS